MNKEIKEKGAAGFTTELKDGVISIYHSTNKVLLKKWTGSGKDWEKIWDLFDELSNENFYQNLEVGQEVLVSPNLENDDFPHEFRGIIFAFKDNLITVVDQDDYYFDVEKWQVEACEEN